MSQTNRSTATLQPTSANPGDRLGVAVLVLMFLGGLWLMAAPFIVGYQDRTANWTTGTINIFVVGAGLALLALTTIIVYVAGVLFELARNSRQALRDQEPQDDPFTDLGS